MEEAAGTPSTSWDELVEEDVFTDSSNSNLPEEKQKKVLLKYIQEKRELQEQLEAKEKSIQEYKVKVYDLSTKVTELQEQIASTKKNSARVPPLGSRISNAGGRSPAPSRTGVVRPSTSKKVTKKKKKSNLTVKIETESSGDTPEPIDEKEIEIAIETIERYKKVAKVFPELKLSVIMEAEKVFFEADINHDGTIDEDELEKLLEKQNHYMTTKKEVKEIMKEIDKDKTGTIDIMEYLAVMERVQQRKSTNLPPSLTRSSICKIQ